MSLASPSVKVHLHWTAPAPHGNSFSIPVRFDHQGDDWKNDAWSLVFDVEAPPDANGKQLATAKFLATNAPHNWLAPGRRFTLQADKPIAEGVVIEAIE